MIQRGDRLRNHQAVNEVDFVKNHPVLELRMLHPIYWRGTAVPPPLLPELYPPGDALGAAAAPPPALLPPAYEPLDEAAVPEP